MANVQRRVQFSGGVLGPLNVDDLNVLSRWIDKSLKAAKKGDVIESLDVKEAQVLEKADGYFKDAVQKATTTGQVF